jgi:CBS domain containing-hemolysin-like protein
VLKLFKPFVWFLSTSADVILKLFKITTVRDEKMTFEDMSAMLDQGAKTGILEAKEHTLIENVFSLTDRSVLSAMTPKADIIFLDLNDSQDDINAKVLKHPHSRFLVCDTSIDNLLGYIESTKLLQNLLLHNSIPFNREKLNEQGLKSIVTLPDSLTLLEVLDKFREYHENIAAVINEFGMVIGLITLNDVLSTIMGNVVSSDQDAALIVKRAEDSWLIDGQAAIEDVKKLFNWEELPGNQNYETMSGFLMYLMKCIPKKAQTYTFQGVKFEVVDVEKYRVDEVMATLLNENMEK